MQAAGNSTRVEKNNRLKRYSRRHKIRSHGRKRLPNIHDRSRIMVLDEEDIDGIDVGCTIKDNIPVLHGIKESLTAASSLI